MVTSFPSKNNGALYYKTRCLFELFDYHRSTIFDRNIVNDFYLAFENQELRNKYSLSCLSQKAITDSVVTNFVRLVKITKMSDEAGTNLG